MSNYNSLKTTIDANIKQNGRQEITGQILNSVLNQMVTTLGAEYQFAGVATIDTKPGAPDAKVFYIANGKGSYTNFGGLEVTEDDVVVLYWDSSWHKVSTGIASNEKLSELGQEVDKLMEGAEIISSTNLYNKDAAGCVTGKYVNYTNGKLSNLATSKASDYIPVVGGQYYIGNLPGQMAWYDADKVYISGYQDLSIARPAPADAAYMRVSIFNYATADATAQVNVGEDLLPYEQYYEKVKNLNLITTPNPDSIVPAIPNNSILVDKIAGETAYGTNLYNKDAADCVEGKYVNYTNGSLSNSSSAKASGYIPVTAGKYYIGNVGMCAFYNSNKEYISGATDLEQARLAPENAAYMRVSIFSYETSDATAQVNVGEDVLPYEPFHQYKKNLDLITTPDLGALNQGIADGIGKNLYPGFEKITVESLANNESLLASKYPQNARRGDQLTMFANVTSWGNGIVFGKILANNYGSAWLEITATQIIAKVSYNGTVQVVASIDHNLTIQTYIKVAVTIYADKWFVILQTLAGTFTTDINIAEGQGVPTVKSVGASLTNVELSCTNAYFNKHIWAFGDSYYGMTSAIRQLYWLRQWGYLNCLVDALAGTNSQAAFADLKRCLTYAKPKYIIWSLGMNDSTFAVWKDYAGQVIRLCEKNDITLILTTIPQPASSAVVEKDDISDWIRSSGLRYIDAAKAVGSDADGHWYGYGTAYDYQSDDNIHCSEYGAKAIATQFLIDVPEIMQ